MEGLVSIVPVGNIILDPFAGSGTTLIAAKKLERNLIRIEKDARYWRIASDRGTAYL